MPRPRCCRRIASPPEVSTYGPGAGTGNADQEVVMSLDEFEAIRLADLKNMYHVDAAALMEVSRATFGRIVSAARGKMADALSNGKTLRIKGGQVYAEKDGRHWCSACPLLADSKGCPQARCKNNQTRRK
jgi:uncharacterized protein